MANEHGFSHITVSADDDDDIVIQAGAVEAPGAVQVEEVDEAETVAVAPEPEEPAEPAEPEPVSELEPPAELEEPARRAAPAAPPADGYRETTLEDIESSKMTTAQKAVIVVALLGIAAFVLWFLLAQ